MLFFAELYAREYQLSCFCELTIYFSFSFFLVDTQWRNDLLRGDSKASLNPFSFSFSFSCKDDAQEAKQVAEKGIENNERLSGAKNKPTRNDEKNKQTNKSCFRRTIVILSN